MIVSQEHARSWLHSEALIEWLESGIAEQINHIQVVELCQHAAHQFCANALPLISRQDFQQRDLGTQNMVGDSDNKPNDHHCCFIYGEQANITFFQQFSMFLWRWGIGPPNKKALKLMGLLLRWPVRLMYRGKNEGRTMLSHPCTLVTVCLCYAGAKHSPPWAIVCIGIYSFLLLHYTRIWQILIGQRHVHLNLTLPMVLPKNGGHVAQENVCGLWPNTFECLQPGR